MQIKTTMRSHYTPVKKTKIQKCDNVGCWRRHGAAGALFPGWWECEMVQPFGKAVWWSLTKLNMLLLFDLAMPLLGVHLNELKAYVHIKFAQ